MIIYSNVIIISLHLSPYFTLFNVAMLRQFFGSFVDELHVVGFSPMFKGNIRPYSQGLKCPPRSLCPSFQPLNIRTLCCRPSGSHDPLTVSYPRMT